MTLVDERGVVPIIVLDEAHALRDEVLHELHGLTSLDFDGRDYLTVWLVGHPRLDRRLRLQQHAALAAIAPESQRSGLVPSRAGGGQAPAQHLVQLGADGAGGQRGS